MILARVDLASIFLILKNIDFMRGQMNHFASNQHHYQQGGGYPPNHGYSNYPYSNNYGYRRDYQDERYYDGGNFSMLFLLIFLGFVAYGVYYLGKNYDSNPGVAEHAGIEVFPYPEQEKTSSLPDDYDIQHNGAGLALPEEYPDVGEDSLKPEQSSSQGDQLETQDLEVPPVVPNTPAISYYTQVGVFSQHENAVAQRDHLTTRGLKAVIVQLEKNEGAYHLIVGGFDSEAEAKAHNNKAGRIFQLVNGRFYEL